MSLENITTYESCSAVKEIMQAVLNHGCTLIQDSKKVTTYATPIGHRFGIVWVSSGVKRESDESSCHVLPIAVAFNPDVITIEALPTLDPSLKGKVYKNSNLKGFPSGQTTPTKYGFLVQVENTETLLRILDKYNAL